MQLVINSRQRSTSKDFPPPSAMASPRSGNSNYYNDHWGQNTSANNKCSGVFSSQLENDVKKCVETWCFFRKPLILSAWSQKLTGWWFKPLWKILVNWDEYSQYMGKKYSKPPTSCTLHCVLFGLPSSTCPCRLSIGLQSPFWQSRSAGRLRAPWSVKQLPGRAYLINHWKGTYSMKRNMREGFWNGDWKRQDLKDLKHFHI